MVFNGAILANTFFIVFIVWLVVLTVGFIRLWRHYNKLTHGVTKHNLREILEVLLANQDKTKNRLKDIEKSLQQVHEDGKFHIQKVGILRFNPFSDTGGSQSFTVAVLDGKSNGIVMTSLYARTGNRWYVKEVRMGKGKDLELSKEELSAISKAEVVKLP